MAHMVYRESDSIAASFSKAYANRGSKGSGATPARAQNTFIRFEEFCKHMCFGQVRPDTASSKQLRLFMETRAAHEIAERTLQNELSHLRRALYGAGRDLGDIRKSENPFSNMRCGLKKVSRKSTKLPCSMTLLMSALEKADIGLQHVLQLQQVLGLRCQEAVRAGNLKEWVKKLEHHHPDRSLHLLINVGTKGGRPRDIFVHPQHVAEVGKVVAEANAFKKINGHLIVADGLKLAMGKYHNQMTGLGMVSDDSGHGLRRLFAWTQYQAYLAGGLTDMTALARLSMDLGHGEGRGRWVRDSYLHGILTKEALHG